MPRQRADQFHGNMSRFEIGDVGMTAAMRRIVGDAGQFFHDPVVPIAKLFHRIQAILPGRRPDILASAVLPEIADIRSKLLENGDVAIALLTLRRAEARNTIGHLDSLVDRDHGTIRRDVFFRQRKKLLNTQAGSDQGENAVSQEVIGKLPLHRPNLFVRKRPLLLSAAMNAGCLLDLL